MKKIHDGRQGKNSKLPQVLNHVRIGISDEEIWKNLVAYSSNLNHIFK